ncbi:damage-control phosphatase ARMT1 family protein [Kitasatospora sp. NPDC096147]|uniref:damage-control phosphatase ARMT1 family protein n=1 Tax=Kitasatospora sp. NPDC096147 TaxID=3364093 RepID=UPI00381F2EC9
MSIAPVIRSDVPGSFSWSVFHERHPALVRRVLDARPYGARERAAVGRLLTESTSGVVEPLPAGAEDGDRWAEWGRGLWGRPWGEVPFLWAESYFYRRLLEATGYFGEGAWRGIDPFAPFKEAELAGAGVDGELAALEGLREAGRRRGEALLASALWGNQADLAFRSGGGDGGRGSAGLLVDDGPAFWAGLERGRGGRVCLVADNAGPELLPDLVLIDELLGSGAAGRVSLYVKPHPYFVSDATMTDVLAAVERLRAASSGAAREAGGRLYGAMADGRLDVRTHPFFCAPLPYREMPADLRADLGGATVTILKGDLNYRRLVEDRYWPADTPFAGVAARFPTPVAALRTVKSEVVTGIGAATTARLDAEEPGWRTSGRHAVVQVCGTSPSDYDTRSVSMI